MSAYAKVATVLGSFSASSDIVESVLKSVNKIQAKNWW
jgi:hypothetical protein